ncbi:MAG: type II secretion system F family protein [Deltaproteobacteria bacterium]|nr:type II secretion system F family protein [Deltaproteobacteria bacterium]
MNSYSYKALDAKGALIRGVLEADNTSSVHENLTTRGLYVLYVKESSVILKKITDRFITWRIRRKDIIEFSSNLSIMIRAGVPILTAIDDIIDTIDNEHLKATISDIKKNIEMGARLSDALELHKAVFPDILIRLVRVGEETGRLEESLSEVAEHLQKLQDLASTVKRALIYPLFSLITTGAAVIFWLAYVLPKIMQVIRDLGVKMPLLTKILYELSKFTEQYWYIFPIIPVLIFFVLQAMKLRPVTRYYLDYIKIKTPIIRLLTYNKLLALFSEQLRLLITAGITIDRSLEIAAEVMGNEVFKKAILDSKMNIVAGNRISDSLSAHSIFPPLFIRMVAIGESSGNLDKQFGFLATHYYKLVDDFSDKVGKMIEPILIITLGCLMGLMVAGVLLPMYDVFTKLAG